MTLPTSRDVPALARSMSNAVDWLNLHGADALVAKISKAPREPDPERLAHLPVSDGGSVTAAEGPAVAFADRELKLSRLQQRLRERIAQVNDDLGSMVREIAEIQEMTGSAAATPATADVTYCAELYCEDESDGRNGRCDPCMQQLYRKANTSGQPWQHHSPLPREFFDQRKARRAAAAARAEGRKNVPNPV